MTSSTLKATCCAALLIALAGPVCSPAVADPVPATATTPSGKLAAGFSDFAGSPENSASLVNGLRTGAPITLTDPAVVGGPPPNSTTFTSPTKPMGYGNVRIALSLAQTQLASEGISNPTAAELQGALIGRTYVGPEGTTTTDGVLQMRASGMGWGKIANTMGYKLGPVVSGKQTLVATNRVDNAVTTATGPGASAGRAKGVVTASGGASEGSKGVVTGSGSAPGGKQGRGYRVKRCGGREQGCGHRFRECRSWSVERHYHRPRPCLGQCQWRDDGRGNQGRQQCWR